MPRSTNTTIRARILLVVTASLVLFGGGMHAATAAEPERAAVVTPLLEAARVGNTLGPALLCPTALGVVQQALAFGPPEAAELAAAGIDQANQFCADLSAANAPVIEAMIEQAALLAPANPALNSAIDVLVELLASSGSSSGDLVGGSSLVQVSETVAWLRG